MSVGQLKMLPALFLLLSNSLPGIDFPDPIEVLDPGTFPGKSTASPLFLPFTAGSLSYDHALLLHSPDELFQLRTSAFGTLIELGTLSLGYRFDSFLLAGPVDSSESAASAAEFWLNAVQYEYGLHLACRLSAGWSVLGEYSRLSLHPLRGEFDETAYDILKLGLAPPLLELKAGRLESYLRVGHHSLFPFWESELSEYRVRYSVSPRMRLTGARGNRFYLDAEPAMLVLRDGDIGYEIYAESGLTISSAGGSFRPYLWLRFNDDAELVANTTEGSRQIGLGFRLTTAGGD